MAWRPMRAADLPAVVALADRLHPAYPEGYEVFAERLELAPLWCRVLQDGGGLVGYALAHPWAGPVPPLGARLGRLPAAADGLHLHDIALDPAARGAGHAGRLVAGLLAEAAGAGLRRASLVAIGGKAGYWARHGFAPLPLAAGEALGSYGPGAVLMRRRLSRSGT